MQSYIHSDRLYLKCRQQDYPKTIYIFAVLFTWKKPQ